MTDKTWDTFVLVANIAGLIFFASYLIALWLK